MENQNNEEVDLFAAPAHDDLHKEINCYLNSQIVNVISYKKCERHKYENTFYWFGCGSMMCPDEHRHIGDFDFELSFLLNKKIISINIF